MHPGDRVKPLVCIYPKVTGIPVKDAAFFNDAWQQLDAINRSNYFGVTSVSPLAKIANPADVNIFDPMHLVYRGNTLLILQRFFSSKFHDFHVCAIR